MTTETSNARGEAYGYEHDGKFWPAAEATPWVIHHATPLYTAPPPAAARGDVRGLVAKWRRESESHPAPGADDVTAETDLLPLPEELKGRGKSGAIKDYARACVSSATEALRLRLHRIETGLTEQISFHVEQVEQAEARAERLAEALQEMLVFYGERVDAECRTKDWRELEAISAARAALDQETTNG